MVCTDNFHSWNKKPFDVHSCLLCAIDLFVLPCLILVHKSNDMKKISRKKIISVCYKGNVVQSRCSVNGRTVLHFQQRERWWLWWFISWCLKLAMTSITDTWRGAGHRPSFSPHTSASSVHYRWAATGGAMEHLERDLHSCILSQW